MYDLDAIKQALWEATSYGLQFFQDEFSSEIGANRGCLKGFRVRPEDHTGSCHIHQKTSNAPYTFTDFGISDKGMNAIDYVQQRDHCTFWEAMKKLCTAYGVPLPDGQQLTPTVQFEASAPDSQGQWHVEFNSKYTHTKTLERLFPFYTTELLQEYAFKEVISYDTVGRNEAKNSFYKKTSTATPDFPIFGYDKGHYVKLYQPLAPKGDKNIFKHSFVGDKAGKRIIYGWDRLEKKVELATLQALSAELKNAKTDETRREITKQMDELKLDNIIIATGGTDGINIASLGYDVIWFNSETEVINAAEYQQLSLMAHNIYYLPDLDATGVRQAVQIADTFIDIRLIWLPNTLKDSGKKDFADWIRENKNKNKEAVQYLFYRMLKQALNFRFWNINKSGNIKFSPTQVVHFLNLHGYYSYQSEFVEKKEDECEFVRMEQGCLSTCISTDIKNFALKWIDSKTYITEVRDRVFSAAAFQPSHLRMLPAFQDNSKHYGANYQWFFFQNAAVKVSTNQITEYQYDKQLPVYYWDNMRVSRPIQLAAPAFETYTDDNGRTRLRVLHNNSHYFKVLINASRIYWEKDADEQENDLNFAQINSQNLTDDENYLQELHLMNKMYCVGYLLHQHKSESNAYIVMGTDYKGGNSVRGSYGGTGKSFLINGVRKILNTKYVDGKELSNNKFPYDKVTENTRLVFLDDMNFNQDFRDFYNKVTGDFEANHKGGRIIYIPFDRSPKMAATTNYVPDFEESSLVRRLLFYQNSDYYHAKTPKNDYVKSHKISDDFGNRDIMSVESPQEEWNADYNFLFNCLQFYLATPKKIEAPLEALENRRTMLTIGDTFITLFNSYFADEQHLNAYFSKPDFNREVQAEVGSKYTSLQIERKLKDYCVMNGWELSSTKRRINGTIATCFFVETPNNDRITTEQEPQNCPITTTEPTIDPLDGIEDNIPF